MLVMKFKGAVLQNQEALAEVKNRIKDQQGCCIVVISALKGVMPRLRQLYALSLRRGAGFENEFNELKQVHEQLAYELWPAGGSKSIRLNCRRNWMICTVFCIMWEYCVNLLIA